MKFDKEIYLNLINLFDDDDIRCHKSKIVKVKKQHECYNGYHKKFHIIEHGEYARVDSFIFENEWYHFYTCLDCLEKSLIEIHGIDPVEVNDYSYLENKECEFWYEGSSDKCIVKYIEYDFGITVLNEEDKTIAFCLSKREDANKAVYNDIFGYIVNCIKDDKLIDFRYINNVFIGLLNINTNVSEYEVNKRCPFQY